jgi:hypothetical protein
MYQAVTQQKQLPPASRSFFGRNTASFFGPAGGKSFIQPKLQVGAAHDVYEREADAVADTVVAHTTTPAIQTRCADCEKEEQLQRKEGEAQPAHLPLRIHESGNGNMLQLQRRRSRPPLTRLAPTLVTNPCACLVFIHDDESNARNAISSLQSSCPRYNTAIIQPHGGNRHVRNPSGGTIDPNELFDEPTRAACEANLTQCRTDAARTTLNALRRSFYLAIRDCSNNFGLPIVALHNNALNDTTAYRGALPGAGGSGAHLTAADLSSLQGDYFQNPQAGQQGVDVLRQRLQQLGGAAFLGSRTTTGFDSMMNRRGSTNIFRWCASPDIGECHIGDAEHPDHVIWTINRAEYDLLRVQPVNVVLQTSAGPESQTDLSTMLMNRGAHYTNIETPITPTDTTTRAANLAYIQQQLATLGLNCCDPAPVTPPPAPAPKGPEPAPVPDGGLDAGISDPIRDAGEPLPGGVPE